MVVVPIEGDDGTMDPPSLFVFCCVCRRFRLIVAGLFFERTQHFRWDKKCQSVLGPSETKNPQPFTLNKKWQWSPAPLFGIVHASIFLSD